jgi:cell division protein FtsB
MKTPLVKDPNKLNIFIGLILIAAAFVCILIVFYSLVNAHRQRLTEIDSLEDKLTELDAEKNTIQQRMATLKDEVGRSIALNKLVEESETRYSDEEKSRKEGYLWIDHDAGTAIVTLGALHGLSAGTKLAVLDDANKIIGYVIVDSTMVVVSYVRAMGKSVDDFKGTYFKVKIEE